MPTLDIAPHSDHSDSGPYRPSGLRLKFNDQARSLRYLAREGKGESVLTVIAYLCLLRERRAEMIVAPHDNVAPFTRTPVSIAGLPWF